MTQFIYESFHLLHVKMNTTYQKDNFLPGGQGIHLMKVAKVPVGHKAHSRYDTHDPKSGTLHINPA